MESENAVCHYCYRILARKLSYGNRRNAAAGASRTVQVACSHESNTFWRLQLRLEACDTKLERGRSPFSQLSTCAVTWQRAAVAASIRLVPPSLPYNGDDGDASARSTRGPCSQMESTSARCIKMLVASCSLLQPVQLAEACKVITYLTICSTLEALFELLTTYAGSRTATCSWYPGRGLRSLSKGNQSIIKFNGDFLLLCFVVKKIHGTRLLQSCTT